MSRYERNKGEIGGWIIIGTIVFLILGVIIAGQFFKNEEKLKTAFRKGQTISIIVSCVNEQKIIKGVFVLFLNTNTNRVAIVSILPKTYLEFGKSGSFIVEESLTKKISYDDYKDAIGKLLGKKIDYYIFINKNEFIKIVDMVGGVEIFTDGLKSIDKNVNIPPGLNLLDGDKSLEYISYLPDDKQETSYEQLKRIQNYVRGFIKLKDDFLESFNEKIIKSYFYKNVETNMSSNDFIIFYTEIKKRFMDKVTDFSRSSENIIVYCDKKSGVQGYEYFYMPKKSGEWVRSELKESIVNLGKKITVEENNKIIVEIQNGTDIVGLGLRTKKYLQTYGFDILEVINAEKDNYPNTIVVVRNSEQKATRLANLIKCKRIIKGEEIIEKKVDVTLILGKDFDGNVVK